MKPFAFAAISLFATACASTICPNDSSATRPALAGRYFLGVSQSTCSNTAVPRPPLDSEQHQLTLSSDRKSVSETFVRDGKAYSVEYDVVSIHWVVD